MLSSYRLTADEVELLRIIAQEGDGIKVILKELERMVDAQELNALKYDLIAGDDRQFLYLKAQAEGARKLVFNFGEHLKKIRMASLPAEENSKVVSLQVKGSRSRA